LGKKEEIGKRKEKETGERNAFNSATKVRLGGQETVKKKVEG